MADSDKTTDKVTIALQWAAGQPFNNVLLIAILAGGGYVAHYVMTVSIPAHLKQIQEGYERIEESHKADRELIIRQYDKWFDSVIRTKADSTGRVSPGDVIENMWHEGTLRGTDYENGQGVGFEDKETEAAQVRRITTAGGNDIILYGGTTTPTSGPRRSLPRATECNRLNEGTNSLYHGFSRHTARTY